MTILDPARLAVYVVTSAAFAGRSHRDVALAALEGGATAIQLRAPELDDEALAPLATKLAERCREAGVLFVVNDRVPVAVASGADGAHVGQDDDPRSARGLLGPDRVLGISVGDAAQAHEAAAFGADYLGVTVWSTATKPDATSAGLEGVREVVAATSLPVVGIGGIDLSNAAEVVRAGAAGVAVISGVAAAQDPVAATRTLAAAVHDAIHERGGTR